jgi:glucose-1-phosphate adenylyltransferase
MRLGEMWYRGNADAVLQNLHLVEDFYPDLVAVFGADHIYRMDVRQMVAFHLEREADVTVAARPVPLADASEFGVLEVDGDGRVVNFVEKPRVPPPMPGDPGRAYVSMGNYLFRRETLIEALLADAGRDTDHDFGKTIIPDLFPRARVFAYDFQGNEIPGLKPYEEAPYWRDVGTLDAYWRAHMDLLGEEPRFDLDNRHWPILTGPYQGPPARLVGGDFENVEIGAGSLLKRATIRNSILGRGVWVNEGAVIEDSILMDFTAVGKGAHLRRVIVDRFNIVAAGREIGLNPAEDRQHYHMDASGLVVIPRGGRREFLGSIDDR